MGPLRVPTDGKDFGTLPPPPGRWVLAQTWSSLLFAHWSFAPQVVQALLPPALEVDTFGTLAWVGVVSFRMSGVALRGWPSLRAFPELNVRTYVRAADGPGVWFFSLDASSALAVTVARRWFRLPYHRAAMSIREEGPDAARVVHYRSERLPRGSSPAVFLARYGPDGPPAPAPLGSLEHFLVERYRLYSLDRRGVLRQGEVRHFPWPLQTAWAEIETNGMLRPIGLEPSGAPRLHFAQRVDVRTWPPRAARGGG